MKLATKKEKGKDMPAPQPKASIEIASISTKSFYW
jgi:hypothetical protein